MAVTGLGLIHNALALTTGAFCINMARLGFIVLNFETFGQGERGYCCDRRPRRRDCWRWWTIAARNPAGVRLGLKLYYKVLWRMF